MSPNNGEQCRGLNDSGSHSNDHGVFTQQIGGGSGFIVFYSWLLLLTMHCASGHLEY